MIQESDENIIKKHLLGSLTEEERSHAEEKLFTDDDYFELLTVIEDELIDDYISGDLTEEDRKQFEAHFLSTPERREKLRFARTLKEYVSQEDVPNPTPVPRPDLIPIPRPVWWKQTLLSPYLGLAAAAVLVIGIFIIWPLISTGPRPSRGIAALKEAYREQRPVESRITGFDYAPPPPVTRGSEQEKFDYVARDRAQALIQLEASEQPSARSYHDLGRLYLTQHEFDKAIDQFEKALALDDKNAQLHNDYGVALMEKGKAASLQDEGGNSLEYFARALEQFNKALELNGSLLEALFNRAFCRQEMGLFQQAEEDWRAYLDKDPDSPWAAEARKKLKQLEEQKQNKAQNKEQLFQEFLEAYQAGDDERAWKAASLNKEALSGKSISEQLLNAYFSSSVAYRSEEADRMLRALSYLGRLESQRGGDSYVLGLAQYFGSLSKKQLALLDQAYKLMATGKSHYLQARNDQAIDAYGRAKQIFKQVGDERDALLADYWIAYSYPDKADIKHSKLMYEQLAHVVESRNFKWLFMRVNIGLSVADFSLGNYSKAIEFANRSFELAKQMDDANGMLNAWSCLIEYYRYVGSNRQSLYCVQASLPFINPGLLGVVQIWRHYAIIASAFNSAGFYSAAVDYQKEALGLAQKTNNPATLCVSYAHLGLMCGKAGNYGEAVKNVQLAYETARTCPDEAVGKNQMAYAALQMGHLYRQEGNFAGALESYDESMDIYKDLQFPTFLYQAHKGKLICYISQKNDLLASQEIQVTLDLIEKYRSTILEGENRNNFFDIEQSVYDLAADFEYSRMNNPQRAFEYTEESRARSLLDLLSTQTQMSKKGNEPDIRFQTVSRPLSLKDARQQMPDESQILQYAVLPDKIFMWVVSRKIFLMDELIINQNDLIEKVSAYLTSISSVSSSETADRSRRAKEMYDILISRVEPALDKSKLLCIVPDKILNSIPFASLISTSSNEYLIKDYAISYSPSTSVFIFCSEEAKSKESATVERVLSVGNPRFDRKKFASLPDLPSAKAEAQSVAACYALWRCLVGDEARKSLIEAEAGKSEVVHFALHSIPDEYSPMRSKLVLAKEPESGNEVSNGVLESHEVYKLQLPRTRLVVLSACQTGSDRYYKGEGMLSLARSFLVAHVPLTVASLWAVDSDSTKDLMIRFHKHRREGDPTAKALQRAQLDMLANPDSGYNHPYHWASFFAIGGQTSF